MWSSMYCINPSMKLSTTAHAKCLWPFVLKPPKLQIKCTGTNQMKTLVLEIR